MAARERLAGEGWLALLGGGEFTFDETLAADRAWLAKAAPGPIGFIPAASGSADYGRHLTTYFGEAFGREVEVIPIYRPRDGRRGRNAERIAACPALYLGGGVADHLLEAVAGTPAAEALVGKLRSGGVVAA
ncbi:MAG TPA: Type 1 glutamine amidotransferase-like domain-containing protein, partial [Thermoanaerobaculia bacterium]|nr:Type 1 glutamine amidotransferase-like domain-containing protein [Thermoanaerobaculia bacterium]